MNKIKIISNPYEKRVLFERWNNQLNSWTSIDEDSNSNSKLICSEYQIGFFPFKVYLGNKWRCSSREKLWE